MSVAIVQEWPAADNSTANYDAIDEVITAEGMPDGLIFHAAGFDGNVFRIFDVWEPSDDFDRSMKDRLWPAIEAIGAAGDAPPDTHLRGPHLPQAVTLTTTRFRCAGASGRRGGRGCRRS
jgi:hypothetical protein